MEIKYKCERVRLQPALWGCPWARRASAGRLMAPPRSIAQAMKAIGSVASVVAWRLALGRKAFLETKSQVGKMAEAGMEGRQKLHSRHSLIFF